MKRVMKAEKRSSSINSRSVTLYLLNKKGFRVLSALCKDASLKGLINAVVGARDKGNNEDYYKEIRNLCQENSLPFYDRKTAFENTSKYSIAVGWRWLIYNDSKLIVLHDSLLPKYRGFSPLVNMLINGENKLGVSAIFASEKMDEGEVIAQESVEINYPLKIQDAIALIAPLYQKIVLYIFQKIKESQEILSVSQVESEATYSVWRDEDDYFIDWNQGAEDIKRFVDAVGFPYGGARTRIRNGGVIKILDCEAVNVVSEINAPGKLIFKDKGPVFLCGENAVRLIKVTDLEGEPYTFNDFRIRLG